MISSTNDRSDISLSLQSILTHTFHGDQVMKVAKTVDVGAGKLPKNLRGVLAVSLNDIDQPYQIGGVDFSRAQLDIIMTARNAGDPIEFETFGPYVADYMASDGIMRQSNLIAEDRIGLQLAMAIRPFFPSARLISLYDEYNVQKAGTFEGNDSIGFDARIVGNFRKSLIEILQQADVIDDAIEGDGFLLIPESSRITDAKRLVERLDGRHLIERRGKEIMFVNDNAENPLYRRIMLCNRRGRWLCEALDAAGFLKPENQRITHIVALPSYMKSQQDKVWEILRTLNIPMGNYHNIFYDPATNPQTAAAIVTKALRLAEQTVAE